MANILISDFSLAEMPHGGSEVGNQVLIDEFDLDFVKSTNIKGFSKDDFYVVSNISLMNPKIVVRLKIIIILFLSVITRYVNLDIRGGTQTT